MVSIGLCLSGKPKPKDSVVAIGACLSRKPKPEVTCYVHCYSNSGGIDMWSNALPIGPRRCPLCVHGQGMLNYKSTQTLKIVAGRCVLCEGVMLSSKI